ncbi:PIN domain-containing protein [Halorussus sp. AFM4]|uniref:PIN domain-containing protein n=1 Tax=Halorussus sp. AFM4 TaxID=3421651 RepID=UPI003EC072DE
MAATVAADTSALMMPVEADVRLFEELERLLGEFDCAVPRAVRDELSTLADGNGAEAVAASVGADLAAERCRTVDHDASYADDALVELAPEFDYVVTNDRPLKRRLLDAGAPVIHIRGRNKLAISKP